MSGVSQSVSGQTTEAAGGAGDDNNFVASHDLISLRMG